MNLEQLSEYIEAQAGTVKAEKHGIMLHCIAEDCIFKCLTPMAMYTHRRVEHDPPYVIKKAA